MTAHLPECQAHDPSECLDRGHFPVASFEGPAGCLTPCICPALRACTTRVLGEARAAVLSYADLVDAVGGYSWDEAIAGSLAAIDRLAQEAP